VRRRFVPRLEVLEDRTLLSPPYTLGSFVEVAPTDPFAGCSPGTQIGTFYPGTQVEPRLAVDPTNANHMVGVFQQDRWSNGGSFGIGAAVTVDGGKTWADVVIPGLSTCSGGPYDRATDPWVSIGPNGTVYVSSLCLDGNETTGVTETAVLVNRSMDGGLAWSQPVTLIQSGTGFFDDKEAVTADPHNPNLVYVVWDQADTAKALLSRSTDGGQTWSAPQVIFQSAYSVAHQILVLPNGTLVDAFLAGLTIEILRSTDGGLTWNQPIVAAREVEHSVTVPAGGSNSLVRASNEIPELAVDPNNGNLYAVWGDSRFSSNAYDSIAFSMSADGSLTWSAPIQINQTPVNSSNVHDSQAFTPSITVGADGTVAVSYYDFRFANTLGGAGTDSWVVFGNPGGSGGLTNPASWGNELRLTSAPFNILNAPNAGGWFLGDYEGLAAAGNNFEAFFSETGSASQANTNIFARQILEPAATPATISISNTGVLTYTSGRGAQDSLSISWDATTNTYTFTDTAEEMSLSGLYALLMMTGSGPNWLSITGNSVAYETVGPKGNIIIRYTPNVSAMRVNMGNLTNVLNLEGTGVPTTITNLAGGQDSVILGSTGVSNTSTMAAIQGTVSVSNPLGSTSLALYDGADSAARSVSMYDGSITGLAPATINWTPNTAYTGTGGVNFLTVDGGSGGNTWNVYGTSNFFRYTSLLTSSGSAPAATVYVYGTLGPLYVNGGADNQVVYVGGYINPYFLGGGGSMQNIHGLVDVTNSSGTSSLILNDTGDATGRTGLMYRGDITGLAPGTIQWSPASSTYGGVNQLTVWGGSGNNNWYVYDTDNFPTLLYSGVGYNVSSSVNVLGTTGPLEVDGMLGIQTVTVGSNAPDTGGTMEAIQGMVSVDNLTFPQIQAPVVASSNTGRLSPLNPIAFVGGDYQSYGSSYLVLDDSGDTTGRTAWLSTLTFLAWGVPNLGGAITGLSPAAIQWIENVPGFSYGSVDGLTAYGGSGGNTWNVGNTSAFYYDTHLVTGAGNDLVNVLATTGPLSLDNNGGSDTVIVGSQAPALGGTLANINGQISVSGAGATALTLDDSADTAARTATLTSSSLTGLSPANIYYGSNVSGLAVNGGLGNDLLTVIGTSPSTPVTFNGGGGINTLIGPNTNNSWNIAANDAGNVGNVAFSSIQNLTGGTANDNFVFNNGTGVTGTINGGGGFDTLDYHQYATGVTVNLLAGTATGTGGVVNVHNVIGSPLNDTITGDNAGDVITLNGGKDIVTGGAGNDAFVTAATQLAGTKVTGGGATDTLVGGNISNTWTISSAGGGNLNGKVTFSAIANLVGGNLNDTYKFTGASPSLAGTINDLGGTNRLDYSGYTGGAIAVNLQTSAASLINGGAAVGFTPGMFSSLVGSTNAGDILIAANRFNNWNITGTNAGRVNSFSFRGIENLVGGSGVDIFKISPAGTALSIDGGGAPAGQGDWLDYSAFTILQPSVTVNLATGSATNVNGGAAGSVTNIQNVHGGNGGNTLTGNALGNILIGGTGADTITGGSGRSLLIGDQGADQITGGSGGSASGGDILVGGTTIWDSDTNAHFQALISILAEWQSGNSYASRVSHLRLGGGLNGSNKLIWGTTVKDDGVANVLTAATSASSPAVDWFFTGAFDTAVNTESGEANNNGIY
jgi:hypothetical protein